MTATRLPDSAEPASGGRFGHVAWPSFLFAFGFLLASYPARNTDIWGHLAAGRDAGAELRGGSSFTLLYDVLAYWGYALGGGFLLVFGKAVAMGLLGVVLYQTAKSHSMRALPAAVVGLVLLSLSLRANLQPQSAGYLLLGLLLLCLDRHHGEPTRFGGWLLFGLFLAWVNLDRGFVYGLAVFALVWLGWFLDGERAAGRWRWLIPALVAGACLLNPAHLYTTLSDPVRRGEFPVPVELQMKAGQTAELRRSPASLAYVRSVSDSPAALAYYPLLALSVLGFAWNRRGFRWERFLPSLLLALLSLASDRAIPIFAIVAGPMAARNLGEALAAARTRSASGTEPTGRRRPLGAFQVLLAGLFMVAAWPGWLQRPPYEPRRWAFDLPASPAAAAEYLRSERTPGSGNEEGRTLHLNAESQTAFRWFGPDDPGLTDPKLAAELLAGRPAEAERRAAGITRIVVYHPALENSRPALNALLRDRYRWPLLYVGGDVAVFGWRDPNRSDDPFTDRAIDLTQIWNPRLEADRAPVPLDGPPLVISTWRETIRDAFTKPRVVPSRNREEAALLMLMADVSQQWIPQVNALSWDFELSAGLVGGAAGVGNPLLSTASTAFRFQYLAPPVPESGPSPLSQTIENQFEYARASKDDFLTGALSAAVRAGRRAVAEDPNDPRAHLALGEACLDLMWHSRERVWSADFKNLRDLRQAQAAAALRRAVEASAKPSPKAHQLLALMYRRMGYLDLGLEHLDEARKAEKVAAPRAKPGPDAERDHERLRDQVKQRRDRFDQESAGLRVADQADLAGRLGLPGLALALLLKSDIAAFGAAGLKQQLDLMVRTGQARLVVEWTSPDQQDAVGLRSYHWLRAQAFAGLGDYNSADRELVEIGGGPDDVIPNTALLISSTATLVSKNVLGEAPHGSGLPDAVGRAFARAEAVNELRAIESQLRNLAEIGMLRGVLALEVGDGATARRQASAVLFFAPVRAGGVEPPMRAMGRGLLDRTRPPDKPGVPRRK